MINPQGLSWRYSYYRDGRVASETDFNGATTTFRYDAAGRLAERSNAVGQSIRYSYDVLGRPIAETTTAAGENDPFAGELTQLQYGPDGALVAATNVHGAGSYTHDHSSRVRTAAWNGHTVVSALNAAGQLIGVHSPSGVHTEYGYDTRGVLSSLGAAGRMIDMSTDAAGFITDTEMGRTSVQRHFDAIGRLVAQTWRASDEGQLFLGAAPAPVDQDRTLTAASYTYRPDGALVSRTLELVGSGSGPLQTDYGLDALGRITHTSSDGAIAERYRYDATNNIVFADGPGEPEPRSSRWEYRGTLLSDDGRSRYSYDRAGRLIRTVTKRLGRKPDVWHYQWDAYDRLRTVTTLDGQDWTYGYDAAGRRTHKTNTVTGETTTFAWLGNQLVEQTTHPAGDESAPGAADDWASGTTTTWSYLPGGVTPLAQIQTTPTQHGTSRDVRSVDVPLRLGNEPAAAAAQRWSQPEIDREFYAIVTDHLGTPTHLIDPAAGTVAGHATATLWGHTTWTGKAATPLRSPANTSTTKPAGTTTDSATTNQPPAATPPPTPSA